MKEKAQKRCNTVNKKPAGSNISSPDLSHVLYRDVPLGQDYSTSDGEVKQGMIASTSF